MAQTRILLIASLSKSLIHFRGDFIAELIRSGYSVYTAAPDTNEAVHEQLLALGAQPAYFKLQRTGLNPLSDLRTLLELRRLIRKNKIDLVFPYTIKPVVYGSLAASSLGVPVVSLITGLGFTFSNSSGKARRLQQLSQLLYRFSLRKNACVIFQNADDLRLFQSEKLLGPSQKTAVVNGSGVRLDAYPFRKITQPPAGTVKFAMVARLIKEKGIHLYLRAAEALKKEFPHSEFHVIGSPDGSSSAIEKEVLENLHSQKIITYHGSTSKVPQLLAAAHVFVLPTFYREGIPRSILEALSIGLPVITTDTPGCRETVREGVNGFLITPKSEAALSQAMRYFLEHPDQIAPMGLASRKLAESKFDVPLINRELLKIINSLGIS